MTLGRLSATLVTVEDLGDATAELLALLFVARGLDPRRVSDLSALREQLGALDDENNPGPRRRQVDPWRRLLARSQALRARLGIEGPLERGLASQLLVFETLVVERIGLEERLPRWRPRRFAATQWHVERRELEARIDDQLGRVIADVGALARWFVE
jgi:hypothetical protein